jgi:hypothetical protein
LYDINTSVVLRSVLPAIFLNGLWEEKVIIKGIKFPGRGGVQHAVAFEMECESDMTFDLTTINDT